MGQRLKEGSDGTLGIRRFGADTRYATGPRAVGLHGSTRLRTRLRDPMLLPRGLTFGPTNGPEDIQELVFIVFAKRVAINLGRVSSSVFQAAFISGGWSWYSFEVMQTFKWLATKSLLASIEALNAILASSADAIPQDKMREPHQGA